MHWTTIAPNNAMQLHQTDHIRAMCAVHSLCFMQSTCCFMQSTCWFMHSTCMHSFLLDERTHATARSRQQQQRLSQHHGMPDAHNRPRCSQPPNANNPAPAERHNNSTPNCNSPFHPTANGAKTEQSSRKALAQPMYPIAVVDSTPTSALLQAAWLNGGVQPMPALVPAEPESNAVQAAQPHYAVTTQRRAAALQ